MVGLLDRNVEIVNERQLKEITTMDPGGFSRADLTALLKAPQESINVVASGEIVLGYLAFVLRDGEPRYYEVVRLFVRPDSRRKGVGTSLMNALKDRTENGFRRFISWAVGDEQLGMHLFLKDSGFKAMKVLKEFGLVKYLFEWSRTAPTEKVGFWK